MTARILTAARALAVAAMVAAAAAVFPVAPAQADYSDAELDAFVTAAITVESLAEQWIARIKSADSEEAAAELRGQANAEVQEAIDGIDGMSVEQYKAINADAREDQRLAERIVEIYRNRMAQ